MKISLIPSKAYEHEALATLPQLLGQDSTSRVCLPTALHFDAHTHTVVIEDVGALPSLKEFLSKETPTSVCQQIGSDLGQFLAQVHLLSATRPSVLRKFGTNEAAKQLSALVYFNQLPSAAAKYGHSEPFIAEAAAEGEREVLEPGEDVVLTLGDFWTGNVLVLPSSAGRESGVARLFALDFELCKPGTAAFDIGQMAAEMYCLAKFKDWEKGMALLEGFLGTYRDAISNAGMDQESEGDEEGYARRIGGDVVADMSSSRPARRLVDPAKVSIRIGAHLVVMGPMGWAKTAGDLGVRELAEEGVELIRTGWSKDVATLKDSMVGTLYLRA